MKVLVLGGGDSPEREVSLRSAKAVAEAARTAGFEVTEADPKTDFHIIDTVTSDTIVLPILHGKNGEDGVIQKDLENRNLQYLGSDSRSSANCFDKWITRQELEKAGVSMPRAVLVSKDTYHSEALTRKPHALKVQRGGSSIGTILVRKHEKVTESQLDELFSLDTNALVEELIEGTEITVPVLDNSALPIIEIVPPKDEEFDYDNKYNGRTQEICPPESISEEVQWKAQKLSEKVHRTMNCRHLSRVDIMIDKSKDLYVLEINTMPGMTDQSLFPKAAAVAGISMPELVKKFVDMVKRDYSN